MTSIAPPPRGGTAPPPDDEGAAQVTAAGDPAAEPTDDTARFDVVLIDDHPLLQAGLAALLQQHGIRAAPIDPTSIRPEELIATVGAHGPSLAVVSPPINVMP